MRTRDAWTTWTLGPRRIVLELDERLTAGVGIELEIEVCRRLSRSFGIWRVSQTGEPLGVVVGGEA